jgi:hypothetical protein
MTITTSPMHVATELTIIFEISTTETEFSLLPQTMFPPRLTINAYYLMISNVYLYIDEQRNYKLKTQVPRHLGWI